MTRYAPDPDSLREHGAPDWLRDAKLGVMVTWGLYSVPAWAPRSGHITDLLRNQYDRACALTPYAEWYENSLKFPEGETAAHHAGTWPGRDYAAFRGEFEAGLEGWRAEPWAELFAAAGARYVVPVTKHHDSYALWPSAVENPLRGRWSVPRDLIGDLAGATRAQGMRFGVYYSGGLDWTFDARPVANLGEMLASMPTSDAYRAYVLAHYAELIERYDPDLLWNDIGYPNADDLWPLLARYYNGREDRAVNDRFGPAGGLQAALQDPATLATFNDRMRVQMADPALAFAPGEPPSTTTARPSTLASPTRARGCGSASEGWAPPSGAN
jgi:alpha-L-fucosidase